MAEKINASFQITSNERDAILKAAKTENRSFSNFIVTRLLEVLKEKYGIVPEEDVD